MNRRVIAALSTALLFGGPVLAEQKYAKPAGDEMKVSTADPTGEMKTTEGTVKEFEANKRLVLTSIDNKTLTFKLDQKGTTVNIDPSVAVGSRVKVTEQKSGSTKSLTVELISAPATSPSGNPGARP